MEWAMSDLETLKTAFPDYAKDVRLNLDSVLQRSSLSREDALAVALAAAFAASSSELAKTLAQALPPVDASAALSAASLMGMNNVWYPYVDMAADPDLKSQPAQLRMQAYASHGGVERRRFEMFALAASIVGKCRHCVQSHYELLKKEGLSAVQLRDVGRIAAVVAAAAQVLRVAVPQPQLQPAAA
jgi:lipoyl-dependent peroxiredoxin subunit D